MINNKSLRISHIFFNKEIMPIYKYFKIVEHEVKLPPLKKRFYDILSRT